METTDLKTANATQAQVISSAELLEHWQGHRRVTRKVIEAFPEDKLFNFSLGGMRPFSELVMEMIRMGAPGIRGIQTGQWRTWEELNPGEKVPATRQALLRLWDMATQEIDRYWKLIPPHRFHETDTAFGQYTGTIYSFVFYFLDNEIHHRGQGYVYLRALDIAPPPFWERD